MGIRSCAVMSGHIRRMKSPLNVADSTPGGEFLAHLRDNRGNWTPVSGPDSYHHGSPHDRKKQTSRATGSTTRSVRPVNSEAPSTARGCSASPEHSQERQELESLKYLCGELSEEGDDLRAEMADVRLSNQKLLRQVAALEEAQEGLRAAKDSQIKDASALLPRFESMKAERAKWQHQIAELKLELNVLHRDSDKFESSHKELQDLRSLVANSNNPKHMVMAKIANLESSCAELTAHNEALKEETAEANSQLAYMKGRLNEWTYYQKDPDPTQTPEPEPEPAPKNKSGPAGYAADQHADLMAQHNATHPVINKKMNFSANLGSKASWFKGSK